MRKNTIVSLVVSSVLSAGLVMAQAPAPATEPPPPAVTGNVSFGLGLTSGNKDTMNFNAGYEFKYDPKTKNVVKSTGLFLYGKTDGELTNEQYGLSVRDEYSFSPRAFVFGEMRYLHDRFKGIRTCSRRPAASATRSWTPRRRRSRCPAAWAACGRRTTSST